MADRGNGGPREWRTPGVAVRYPLAILELLAFNTQKIKGHVTVTTPPFRNFFSEIMSALYLGSCTPNLKFATLAILELLAFNAQKLKVT